MKLLKVALITIAFPLLLSVAHKYYVSVTQITFVEEKKSVQIITRIDADDMELTLQERYSNDIVLTNIDEDPKVDNYIKTYLDQKLRIKIDTQEVTLNYIGKEYENDLMVCYLEIENISSIATIEISNRVLFDLFPKQKNIVKTKINSKVDNLIFTKEDQQQFLNFE